jgi:hypothetical protein
VLEQNAEKNVCTERGSDRRMEKTVPRGASHLKYSPSILGGLTGIAQSVKRLATIWTVGGSNPGGGEVSRPVHIGPCSHPPSYTVGTGSFSGVKRSERGVDNPPPSSAEVKKE